MSDQSKALVVLSNAPLDSYRPSSGIQNVSDSVRNFQEASVAPNTKRAYDSDWRAFERYCEEVQAPSLPAHPLVVSNYLAHKADLIDEDGQYIYASTTINRWIASINKKHFVAGHVPPGAYPGVSTTLAGIRRLRKRPARKMSPLLLADLRKTLLGIDFNTFPDGAIGHRDAAIILFGFAGAFRRSELAELHLNDVTIHPEDGLHIRVQSSKTDQEGRGSIKAIPYGANPVTCAPCAFVRWVQVMDTTATSRPEVMKYLRNTEMSIHVCKERVDALGRLNGDAPLFRTFSKGGYVSDKPISGHVVNNVVKRRVAAIGMNETRYGGHSLRAGFVTQAFRAGASAHEIMRQTGHSDPATLEIYSRENDPLRQNAVTRLGL